MPDTLGRGPDSSRAARRTFAVDDSTMSPSFDGIAAVARVEHAPERSLAAAYFDTASHGLAARQIGLRRCTGGPDPQWQLKLPAGPDALGEVHVRLEDDTVPGGLVDIVAAVVRDRPLAPVACINTARAHRLLYDADGALLAEFRDERITAEATGAAEGAQHWRQWHLKAADAELVDRLGHRLLDAGAAPLEPGCQLGRVLARPEQTPVRASDRLHRTIGEYVDDLLAWDRAVRADADDAVHQMRVTTRKIRSLLQAAIPGHEPIVEELRLLAAVLGVARDAEVLAQRYRPALAQLDAQLVRGRVRQRLVDGAVARYNTGLRRSLTAMRSPRYFRLLDDLDALTAGEPAGGTDLPATIDAAYRRVRKATKAARHASAGTERNAALHRIRKGAKRLRYTAAATGATKVAARAKAVQTLLGEHQDAVVSQEHLIRCAEAALAAGEDTFSYGVLYQREDDLARHCRERLGDALGRLDKAVRRTR